MWLLLLGAKTSGNCPQKTEIYLDYEEIFAYFLQKFTFFNCKARPWDKWKAQVLQHCVLYVRMWPFSPFVRASHPQPSLCVSYREVCAAIVCMDAAATHYPGSRSLGSWRGERHPTPPRPFPQPATLFWTPCRGRTWSSRRSLASRVDLLLRHGHHVSKKERTRKKGISGFGSVNQIENIKKCCFRLIYCWQWQLLYLRISILFFFFNFEIKPELLFNSWPHKQHIFDMKTFNSVWNATWLWESRFISFKHVCEGSHSFKHPIFYLWNINTETTVLGYTWGCGRVSAAGSRMTLAGLRSTYRNIPRWSRRMSQRQHSSAITKRVFTWI